MRRRVAELEQVLAARAGGEQELHERSDALAERVKELKCLYSISGLLRGRQADLGEILQAVVDVLPSAWQLPARACACISLNGRRLESRDFHEPRWRQQADIVADGERVGLLQVGYVDMPDQAPAPDFLAEEAALLSTVAERIGQIIALAGACCRDAYLRTHG